MFKKVELESGLGLIGILIIIGIIALTAGGVLLPAVRPVWEEQVAPTSTPTPTPTPAPTPAPTPLIQPTPLPTSPGIEGPIQTETRCSRESGYDTCPTGYLCYWSWECPKGIQDCGPPTGDFLCHKECQSNNDCPRGTPFCEETALMRGDYGNFFYMCMK